MVLSFLGVHRVVRAPMPWSGYLFDDHGDLTVKVRETDSRPRQRFSMLHEGGHTFLPGFDRVPQFRCDPGPGTSIPQRSVEALSDIAASELLFPRRRFRHELTARPTLDMVEALADRYQASITATAVHVVSLCPVDARLVVLSLSTKPSQRELPDADPVLRVQWSVGCGEWPFIPRYKSAQPTGLLMRAFCGEPVDQFSTLGELCTLDERLFLSARSYTYHTADDGPKTQVLAIYSRSSAKIRGHDG
jgi:IrrE N-terminal-like domain